LKIWNLAKTSPFCFRKKIQVFFIMSSIKVAKYDEPPKKACGKKPQMSKWISAFCIVVHVWLFFGFSSLAYLLIKHPSQTC
jgi:hypothetical protein